MEEKRDILKDFTEKMEVLFGRSLNKIILYGSYARGDYKENSDIDIMILTSMSEDEIRIIEIRYTILLMTINYQIIL